MFYFIFKDERELYYFRLIEEVSGEEEFDNSRGVRDKWEIGP